MQKKRYLIDERLKALKQASETSDEDVAKSLGVHKGTIERWRREKATGKYKGRNHMKSVAFKKASVLLGEDARYMVPDMAPLRSSQAAEIERLKSENKSLWMVINKLLGK